MTKTATVSTRVRPDPKERAEHVFRELGLNPTQAIALFYRQVEFHHELPFDVATPAQAIRKTFEDTDTGRNSIVCKTLMIGSIN